MSLAERAHIRSAKLRFVDLVGWNGRYYLCCCKSLVATSKKFRITASHANLIARLPEEDQAEAFENCWRKDCQDKEAHLLPAEHLSAWIQANLYLNLAEAPFDREDSSPTPEPVSTVPAAAGSTPACLQTCRVNNALTRRASKRR